MGPPSFMTTELTHCHECRLERVHALMDGAPIPCALNNEIGQITFLNKAFIKTLGYTLNDIPDLEHWWPLAYPDPNYRNKVLKEWDARMGKAKSSNSKFEAIEIKICCKDGSYKTFLAGASELEEDFKNEHLVTLFDITERIELEQNNQQKDLHYQELFNHAEVSIWNEDLSDLYEEIEKLKTKKIKDIKQYLLKNLDYTYQLSRKIKVVDVNEATLRMFEVKNKNNFLKNIDRSFGDNAINIFINEVAAIYNNETTFRSETNFISSNGKNLNAIISIPIPKDKKSAKRVPVSIFDITELKSTESELLFHVNILNSIAEGVYFIGESDSLIKFSNSRFDEIFGYEQGELIGKHVSTVNAPSENPEKTYLEIVSQLKKNGNWYGEVKNVKKDGTEFWCKASVSKFNHKKYGPIWISIHEDISDRKRNESIIWHQANFDSVCNLPNRNLFSDRVSQEIKNAQRGKTGFSILFIDLDNFKDINDTLGHNIGDKLLIDVSNRISKCLRESDIVSRFGGDEFTVLLSNTNNVDDIELICNNIQKNISKEYSIDNETVFTSASIGVSSYPNDSKDIDTLLKFADQAMYVSKDSGKNCISYFTKDLQIKAEKNRKLSLDLRNALKSDELKVFYQPIINLKTGKIIKAEALIRWLHPINGYISPEIFIPLAEKNKLIINIGDWVFKQCIQTLKTIRRTHPDFQININKSPVQIEDSKSDTQTWIKELKENNLPGNSICIEITEGLLLKLSNTVTQKLKNLTDENIKFALDDFGTGYSSLSYLTKFNLDYIKIDRSFVKNIGHNPKDLALCKAIISMSHSLGKKVVAEGVETSEQEALLSASNCDYAQGFLFFKPLPLNDLLKVLPPNKHL